MTPSAQHTREHGRAEQGSVTGSTVQVTRQRCRVDGRDEGRVLVGVETGQAGDRAAAQPLTELELREFTEFVRGRRGALLAAAYDLTGDVLAAEDLVQSALMATYRAWRRIENKSVATSYVRRTMTNLQISAWRRHRLRECPTDQVPELPDVNDAMDTADLRATMGAALARLTRPQRTVLVLRYYEGLTDTEIAARLGLSVGTVKSTIWRALRRLRDDASVRCERFSWSGEPRDRSLLAS